MTPEYKRSIVSYYDATRLDYRILWFGKDNRSVHFGYYDDQTKSHEEALHNMNRVMARRAGVTDGDLILDAGCGQGGSAVWLAEHFDVHVTGITLVPHQVIKAIKHARRRGTNGRVEFHVKDYACTDFPDESFTLVWACESLCHAFNKMDFYREAYRLLKPGGRLICAEYLRTERPLSVNGEKLLHEWLNGWSINDLDTIDEHKNNAEQCGFIEFSYKDITQFIKPSLRHLHSISRKLWKFGIFLRKFGLRNDVNHGNHYSSMKQYEAITENLWRYGLISMRKGGI